MKFLFLAALACMAIKLLAGRWPWELWGPNAKAAAEKRALNLLGLRADAGYEEIIDAHRHLILKVHPDRGGTADAVHEANAARDLLLARISARGPDGGR